MGVLFFILGACFGSFLSVCIYRIPEKLSVISPHSYCPKCGHKILWYDNIPIISYCLLKGRCRFCKEKISVIYPAVELMTAGVFLITFLKFGASIKLPIYIAMFSLLIIISFVDIEREIIPDVIVVPGIIIGVLLGGFTFPVIRFLEPFVARGFSLAPICSSIIGGAIGATVIASFAIIGKLLFKKEAMGGGDIKLLAMIGSFTGWVGALWTIFLGSIVGLVFGLLTRREKIPFAPSLSIATFIILIIGLPFTIT